MTMQVTRAIVILVGVLFLIGAAGAEPGCCADWHDPQSDVPEAAGALASSEMSGMPLVRIWPTIAWGECPEGFKSECATVLLPLDWRRPFGETIQVFVSRYPAKTSQRKGQLWLLQGGPGGSGEVFSETFNTVFAPWRDYDIYVLEHRGVGESTRLGCPDQEAENSEGSFTITPDELPDCLAYLEQTWGEGLGKFNITNAARDLAYLIMRTRQLRDDVFVYGASYGTLWAQRFLQVAPRLATGVILDSVLPPVDVSIFSFDEQSDPVGMDLSALCADDPVCGQKLGADPWQVLLDTQALLNEGHCAELGIDGFVMGNLGAFLITNQTLRRHLFPLLYRINRCDPADLNVLVHYMRTLNLIAPPQTELGRFSQLLQYNIAFGEITTEPVPSLDELAEACFGAGLCPSWSLSSRPYYDDWPVYDPDWYYHRWFRSRTPVLALNGDLDPQTPHTLAETIIPHLKGPGQNYVQVRFSPHGVLFSSPVRTPAEPTCGMQIMESFVRNPTKIPDTACLSDLLPVTFAVSAPEAMFFFGQGDIWENPARVSALAMRSLAVPNAADLLDRLRSTDPIERENRIRQLMATED